MKVKIFSEKQTIALTWWLGNKTQNYDAIICSGAIRSGKTFCLGISFVLWSFYKFNNKSFAICGKTIKSTKRNFLDSVLPLLQNLGFDCRLKISENMLTIYYKNKKNIFYIFGGKDESSAALIQGLTLSGVLFDEVALMPKNFVEQALARCSDENAKFWFNCNPESPAHWFYKEWIINKKEKNAMLLNFFITDNPALPKKVIERYKRIYSGSFYERFIEGKWTTQSGLIYPFMTDNSNFCKIPDVNFSEYIVSCDYGIINPTSCGLWGKYQNTWYRIDEYYYDSKIELKTKTDEEHYNSIKKMIGNKKIKFFIIDPSAASFIALINQKNEFKVMPAKNDVLGGIRNVTEALKTEKIKICKNCKDSIREFSLYKWDSNKNYDAPIKENDHAMDDIRYFVSTNKFNVNNNLFFAMSLER